MFLGILHNLGTLWNHNTCGYPLPLGLPNEFVFFFAAPEDFPDISCDPTDKGTRGEKHSYDFSHIPKTVAPTQKETTGFRGDDSELAMHRYKRHQCTA